MEGARKIDSSPQIDQISSQFSNSPASPPLSEATPMTDHSTPAPPPEKPAHIYNNDSPARPVLDVPQNNFTLRVPGLSVSAPITPKQLQHKKRASWLRSPSSIELKKFRPQKFKVCVPLLQLKRNQKPALLSQIAGRRHAARERKLLQQAQAQLRATIIESPVPSDFEQEEEAASPGQFQEDYEKQPEGGEVTSTQSKLGDVDTTQEGLLQHRYHSQTTSSQNSSGLSMDVSELAQMQAGRRKRDLLLLTDEVATGALEFGDIPSRVLSIFKRAGELVLEVEWERRADLSKPMPSEVHSDDFKMSYPLKLIEYYERKTHFYPKTIVPHKLLAARSRI